jgi:hypothetical protein
MEIRIHPKAIERHRTRVAIAHEVPWPEEFEKQIRAIEGAWVPVETDHLFEDQFNTTPISGVTKNGMRILLRDVIEIRNDVRHGVIKCRWCHGYDTTGNGRCDECGKSDYLHPLHPKSPPARQAKSLKVPSWAMTRDLRWNVLDDFILIEVDSEGRGTGLETFATREAAEAAKHKRQRFRIQVDLDPDAVQIVKVEDWSN